MVKKDDGWRQEGGAWETLSWQKDRGSERATDQPPNQRLGRIKCVGCRAWPICPFVNTRRGMNCKPPPGLPGTEPS